MVLERQEKIVLYERYLAELNLESKGKNYPYTSHNGRIFSMVGKEDRVGIRLPEAELEAFLDKYNGRILVQYGQELKDYVEIPDEILVQAEIMLDLLTKGLAFVSSMRPRKPKRKK